jgi:hypothetical protein
VEQPAFYNTLTTNCTTAILLHARASGGIARYNWKVLFSGYAPAYAQEIGRLDTSLPFAELKQRSHINTRAQAAGDAADFSQRIRAGLSMPPQPAGEPVETSRRHRSTGFQFPCSRGIWR